jgi:hypothetical protein
MLRICTPSQATHGSLTGPRPTPSAGGPCFRQPPLHPSRGDDAPACTCLAWARAQGGETAQVVRVGGARRYRVPRSVRPRGASLPQTHRLIPPVHRRMVLAARSGGGGGRNGSRHLPRP